MCFVGFIEVLLPNFQSRRIVRGLWVHCIRPGVGVLFSFSFVELPHLGEDPRLIAFAFEAGLPCWVGLLACSMGCRGLWKGSVVCLYFPHFCETRCHAPLGVAGTVMKGGMTTFAGCETCIHSSWVGEYGIRFSLSLSSSSAHFCRNVGQIRSQLAWPSMPHGVQ